MGVGQAASDAYDATLSPIHTYFVRVAIKTSMYLLPDRSTFIASIGETGMPAFLTMEYPSPSLSFLHLVVK
jgi:hypothetical protein